MAADRDSQPIKRLRTAIGKCAAWVADRAAQDSNVNLGTELELSPLAPQFKADQHNFYVSYLNAALNDDGIRNIALTGRYGAGKSSVLKEFARQNEQRVLFLSLSTLGPEDPNETKTNQIEKELVKQLLHREKPTRLPQSRYQRIERLPRWRAAAETAAALVMIALGLWLFGAVPDLPALRGDAPAWVRVGAAAVATVFFVGLLIAVRITVHNRLVVSEVSAGGAAITLTNKSETYFDKYLDEIVYFFESRSQVDVVVFEDLDRFNHAGIFEALRELNTLLNNSKQIIGRPFPRTRQRAIRFVYALRDSIFERLGHDTKELDDDAAQAEAVRANRTKFFDLVIPLVPFITHRTARELLDKILTDDQLASVPKVSDELVDLVARHIPDMRLLTNIRNEYSIFARRLITDRHGMDTLTADQLFALVVYKNLHLEDFEFMLLGRSKLDTVYQLSRDLIAQNMSARRARLRKIADGLALQDAVKERATDWGDRLTWFFNKVARGASNGSITAYVVGGTEHDVSAASTPDFWQKLLEGRSGVSGKVLSSSYGRTETVSLNMDELQDVIGEGFRVSDWTQEDLLREQNEVQAELEALRAADFGDLAKRPDFTLDRDGTATTFRRIITENIGSELGQALIADGYIDRYYNMYAAQYYGERVPTNAMSYIVQNVDTNRPDIYYAFNDCGELAALLKETKRSFLADVSAYNIGILDYLLEASDNGADTILKNVIRHVGEIEREFLDAYLSEGRHVGKAVGYFAARWPAIFTELVDRADLGHDKRVRLVDIALANSSSRVDYLLNDTVRRFLQANYREFRTIASPEFVVEPVAEVPTKDRAPSERAITNAVGTLDRAQVQFDDLAAIRKDAMRLVVEADCYTLTAKNLRTALDQPETLSLDRIRSLDADIYKDALARPDEYLHAIESERQPAGMDASPGQHLTRWTIEDPAAFTFIVSDLAELTYDHALSILRHADPTCIIDELTTVPSRTWEALAECRRFPATLSNVDVYIEYLGEIDADLAAILTAAESVAVPEPSEDGGVGTDATGEAAVDADDQASEADEIEAAKVRVAEAILNASVTIPDAQVRAKLVRSLDLKAWFPVTKVPAEPGPLLGRLIEEGVCNDEAATFAHFNTSDWPTLRYGIKQSAKFAEFVTPELLDPPMTKQLLDSSDISDDLKGRILSHFDEFIPADSGPTLAAAGRAALATNVNPGVARIATIAQGTGDGELVVRLVHRFRDDLTTEEVLASLLQAGEPYLRLATADEKLTFPRNDHHEAVLQRLKASGRINSRARAKSMLKEARIEVEVL